MCRRRRRRSRPRAAGAPLPAPRARPRSDRSTSVHPVNRFSLFHVLSPWRSRTSVIMSRVSGWRLRPAYRASEPSCFFNPQQLVVLADAIGPAGRSGLDLSGRGADRQVGNRRVLGFAGPVRDDRRVARVARHADGIERFGDGADLVELDEQRVGDAVGDSAFQNLRVGHEHVVSHELHASAERGRQRLPPVPVAFREAVFDRDNRVLPQPVFEELDHLSEVRSASPDFLKT